MGSSDSQRFSSVRSKRKILVVGAGVAGLQAARTFLQAGLKVLLVDENDEVGGVWRKNYSGYALQVPWQYYQFPEFPVPLDVLKATEYPTGKQILKYIRDYVDQFQLSKHIQLNSRLLRLIKRSKGGWRCLYQNVVTGTYSQVCVDYVVICTGLYSTPYIPSYEGADSFAGSQIHAKDFTDSKVVSGKHVVIVGAGKSAYDCVATVASSKAAASVTLLYRQAHWPLPRKLCQGLGVGNLLYSRCLNTLLPPFYTASAVDKVVHKVCYPLKRLAWRLAENASRRQFPTVNVTKPPVELPQDLFYGGAILDSCFEEIMQGGQIRTVKGRVCRFLPGGMTLSDGTFLRADIVLYCTGYTKSYSFLDSASEQSLNVQKDGLYLYRNMIPPSLSDIAFVGSEVSSFSSVLTSALQSKWLVQVVTNKLELPSEQEMQADVEQQRRWRRKVMPTQRSRGAVVNCYTQQYHDQLLRDLSHPAKRKSSWNPFAECFSPYTAEDYADLFAPSGETRLLQAQMSSAGTSDETGSFQLRSLSSGSLCAATATNTASSPGATTSTPSEMAQDVSEGILACRDVPSEEVSTDLVIETNVD